MKVHHRLVAGAALGLVALTLSAPAEAKARKHVTAHKHATDARDAKIEELEAKVDALTRRLDQQEAAQQAMAQQAANAQATAASAQNQAATALTQTQAAQVQVATVENEVPPLAKPVKTGWFANTTISGKGFVNVSNIDQKSTDLARITTRSAQNGTQTELKRFYVSVDHKFSDVFSSDVTTDFRYNTNGTSKDVLLFVKKAYLQARFDPGLIVRVGEADMPWVPFDESFAGYRFVEPTLTDRTRYGSSVDWGVHVLGSFADNRVSYQVSAVNGSGYKTLTRGSDTVDLEGRIGVSPIKSVTFAVGGYTGKLGKSAANLPGTATPHTANRFDALAAYTDKRIRAGVEYFTARNWNNVTTAQADRSEGWSAFGSFAFTPWIAAFGRYDRVRPSKGINPALKDGYFNVGLDYKPLAPLDLALVYKRERTRNGTIATANGLIGGPLDGTYDELGVFGQFVF
jgi:hypothetical protein